MLNLKAWTSKKFNDLQTDLQSLKVKRPTIFSCTVIFLYSSADFVTREFILVSNESYNLLRYKYNHDLNIHMV